MFDSYFCALIFTIFLMILLKIMVFNNNTLNKVQKNKFKSISTLILITSISEWLGVFLNGKPLWTRPFHILVKTLELSLAPIIPMLCADIIKKPKHKKAITLICILLSSLEILSAFTGLIFKVSTHNVYEHSNFYWIYIASFTVGVLYFIYATITESKNQFGFNRILILMLPFFLLLGLIFQYLGNDVHIIWLCVAINMILMYTMYIEFTQNLDSLTHTLNRKYYENTLARLSKPSTIFFFDVNDFKSINDTYGHVYGDTTLARVGETLISVFVSYGECFRIGGDEFCAIVESTTINPELFIQKLEMKTEKIRKDDPRFPFIAVGYAKYHPNDNVDAIIEKADQMMYTYKEKIKSQT